MFWFVAVLSHDAPTRLTGEDLGWGWGWEGGSLRQRTIPCQPLLVTVLSDSVKDQAHYKETFFSHGKMYENIKGQAVC